MRRIIYLRQVSRLKKKKASILQVYEKAIVLIEQKTYSLQGITDESFKAIKL